MSNRRSSPTIFEEVSSTIPSLARSRSSISSVTSVSSINSLNGLLSSPTTTTAAATITGSSTAVLSTINSAAASASSMLNNSGSSHSSVSGANGSNSPATSSSTYYPAFPYRSKSRTASVSSTSTITQPVHSLLQTSSGILPKRQTTTPSVAASFSTASATASLASPTLSTSSSSSSPTESQFSHSTMNGASTTNYTSSSSVDGRSTPMNPILVLEPINNNFALKSLELPEHTKVKIGRQTGVTTAPNPSNGYFDSKVLSRIHAEVWSKNGKVYLRDLKSSNGTFLNGKRLCPENVESEAFVLNQNDNLEFGIDIMDENGSLLHEKVACKIYISKIPYPTPGGSPQESHAKLSSASSSSSGVNSTKSSSISGGASAGQSANIDLIISRLQSELTRSQETNANLGIIKQGLGELEKAIVVSAKADGPTSTQSTSGHEKLLEENNQAHAAEITKLTKSLEETQAELNAYIQKTRLLEPLVAEDEILRRDLVQNIAELTSVKLERDLAKDSMNEMINDHQQAMESLRKEHEATLATMELIHKESLERVAREAALTQESLLLKHQDEQAQTLQNTVVPSSVPTLTKEIAELKAEVSELESKYQALQEAADQQTKDIQGLTAEKSTLSQELKQTKAEVEKTRKELEEAQQRITREDLTAMTPASSTGISTSTISKYQNGQCQLEKSPTTMTTSSGGSNSVVSKKEVSWANFVFPMGKKHPRHLNQQPSTIVMSGGFMLVGIGAYVFWHKSG
ncbi:hypothetical protein BG011_003149 [Mortierella polycephala]|uniref:FHA domain-containing protein n=1 Tax=Mortierella polycephala TaxID=41804 RepID=A0A9P6Q3Q9_9FUNG|nr:hypothetical protein BG011_003149 [Mortierella polycephala]